MKIRMRLEGEKQLARDLRELSSKIRRRVLVDALVAAAEPVRQEAARLAPVDRGRLKGSMITVVEGTPAQELTVKAPAVFVKMGPEEDAFYGYFHELGTSKMPAKPFMRPALESMKSAAIQAAAERMARGLAMLLRR